MTGKMWREGFALAKDEMARHPWPIPYIPVPSNCDNDTREFYCGYNAAIRRMPNERDTYGR